MNPTLERFQKLAVSLLPPILVPKAWSSVYDNAQNSPRRGPVPGNAPRDARKDLTPATRRELVRRGRYLYKNSGFVREMVSSMAIYSTGDGIRAQAQSPDSDWNQRAEDYFKRWSSRCEITGRYSFEECQGLVCRALDIDGEYFVLKTRNRLGLPSLQLIETHRIGGDDFSLSSVDGVTLDEWGAPLTYRLLEDNGPREIPAHQVLHVFEPEHSSSVRSAPTIQHSINHVIDEMELIALEKHAVKDNADVTRILKNEAGQLEEGTDFEFRDGESSAESDASNPTDLQRIVGGKLVALKPNESLESFESKRPSPTFTGFLEHLRRDSALGVLPFEFTADSSKIGGAGVRLVVAKADRRFSFRQMILIQRFIRPVWFYVIGDAIAGGELEAVPNWWRISCVTPRRVTVDAGREAQQNRADVEMGLKTISDHYEELGADFGEEIERRARDIKMILEAAERHGVPVELLWKPASETSLSRAGEVV